MDELTSSRKRKRPSYLQDFYDPSLFVDETVLKKADLKGELEPKRKEILAPRLILEVPAMIKKDLDVDSKQSLLHIDDPGTTLKDPVKEEEVCSNIESIEESTPYCSLCGKTMEASSTVWDMSAGSGPSCFSFAAVVEKLIKEEQLTETFTNTDFLRGILCTVCKDIVTILDKLQSEVVKVKSSIISMLRNNEHIEKKNVVEQGKAEAIYQTMVGKWKRIGESGTSQICQENTQVQNSCDKSAMKVNLPKIEENKNEKKGKEKVESLLEKRGYKYLVKWKNCSEASNSWEARFALPTLIVKYYEEDKSRLGTPAPDHLEQPNTEAESDSESEEDDSESDESESEKDEELEGTKLQNIHQSKNMLDAKDMLNMITKTSISSEEKERKTNSADKVEKLSEQNKNKGKDDNLKNIQTTSEAICVQKMEKSSVTESQLLDFNKASKSKLSLKKSLTTIKSLDKMNFKTNKDKLDLWITKPKPKVQKPVVEKEGNSKIPSSNKAPQNKSFEKVAKNIGNVKNKKESGTNNSKREEERVIGKINVDKNNTILKRDAPTEKKRIQKPSKKIKEQTNLSQEIPAKPKRGRKKKEIITEEEEFIVESLLEKKGSKFLVKWEQYSAEWNSWEPKSGLPEFIVKYYEEDLARLGSPAPAEPEKK